MSLATPIRDRFVKNSACTAQRPPQPARPPPYLNPGGARLHELRGMLGGTSPSMVRPPVGPHPRAHRRGLRSLQFVSLQFVRHTSQELLHQLPLHVDPGRCLSWLMSF